MNIFDELQALQGTLKKGILLIIFDFGFLDNEEFKGHCATCGRPIFGKSTSFTKQDLNYHFHPQCFVCAGCQSSMEGRAFYQHQQKYLCSNCYHSKVLGRCDACGEMFTDPTIVKAGGKQYHTKV